MAESPAGEKPVRPLDESAPSGDADPVDGPRSSEGPRGSGAPERSGPAEPPTPADRRKPSDGSGPYPPPTVVPGTASWGGCLGFFVVIAVLLAGSYVWFSFKDSPEDVVEGYFDAIVDKDVDRALTYVGTIGYGVSYGVTTAFLHPDAIADDWGLLDFSIDKDESGADAVATVTIGNDDIQETGRMELSDYGDEWNLVDPFINAAFEATPFTYLQVNGRTVVTEELHAQNVAGMLTNQYKLFPGLYRFYDDAIGVSSDELGKPRILPPTDDHHTYDGDVTIRPPELDFPSQTQYAVGEQFNALLDDCAAHELRQPSFCPFGMGAYQNPDDRYFDQAVDVKWSIDEYPEVIVVDPGSGKRDLGLPLEVVDAGLIRLTAVGLGSETYDVTAECGLDVESFRAALRPDGTPEVYSMRRTGGMLALHVWPTDTCTVVQADPWEEDR